MGILKSPRMIVRIVNDIPIRLNREISNGFRSSLSTALSPWSVVYIHGPSRSSRSLHQVRTANTHTFCLEMTLRKAKLNVTADRVAPKPFSSNGQYITGDKETGGPFPPATCQCLGFLSEQARCLQVEPSPAELQSPEAAAWPQWEVGGNRIQTPPASSRPRHLRQSHSICLRFLIPLMAMEVMLWRLLPTQAVARPHGEQVLFVQREAIAHRRAELSSSLSAPPGASP